MTELPATTCDACGEPMLATVSTLDAHGWLWTCINPRCLGLRTRVFEAADLAGAGVSTSWGTGSDVEDEALAGRLARLVDYYVDVEEARTSEADAPAWSRERAQADLASLRAQLLELGRLAEDAGAVASRLGDALSVSYMSDRFDEAEEVKRSLAVTAALCATVRRTVADAASRLRAIDPELPGFLPFGDQ
jgi:hypothetical protein